MFRVKDRRKCEELFQKHYAGRKFSRGLYEETIQQYVFPGARLLDAGCGRDLEFSREFCDVIEVIGVDLENKLDTRNQRPPYALRGNLESLPFPAAYFDVIISRSVIEHLSDPPRVFREFQRVLRPGGKVILSTPNKFDCVSIIAALTPYQWHRKIVSRVVGVVEDEVFPTLYRANTLSKLRKELDNASLREVTLQGIAHYPVYLMFSPVLFRLGVLYQRLTSLAALKSLRGTLLCVFEKRGASGERAGTTECPEYSVSADGR